MVLELNDIEKDMLKRALESFDEELMDELVRTDKRAYRALLHSDEEVIKKILGKMSVS